MSPVLGVVKGTDCPKCGEDLVFEGEFFEGQEVECSCGWTLEIAKIEATYKIELRPMCPPPQEPR